MWSENIFSDLQREDVFAKHELDWVKVDDSGITFAVLYCAYMCAFLRKGVHLFKGSHVASKRWDWYSALNPTSKSQS